jgi:hypothetical protein
VAEGARLESVYTRKRIEGSNPSLTARIKKARLLCRAFYYLNAGKLFPRPLSIGVKSALAQCRTNAVLFTKTHDGNHVVLFGKSLQGILQTRFNAAR